jgi:hypothetical protein
MTTTGSDDTTTLARSAWTHRSARAFTVLGTIAIVGGGLLSAAIAPAPSYHGSWAVAYIVLVAGVAQIVLGVGQASVTGGRVDAAVLTIEAVLLNAGAAATVVATIVDIPVMLYAAAAAQVVAIILFLVTTRHSRRGMVLTSMRIVAIVMLVATPTGIVIQALTH